MRIFIFDDELFFLNGLQNEIEKWAEDNKKEITELLTFGSTKELCAEIICDDDVFFLDIADGGDENAGIVLAHEIRKKNSLAHIIFVTSHYEKIREAMTGLIRPSEFLIKPLDETEKEKLHILLSSVFSMNDAESVDIKIGRDRIHILLNEILYISREMRKTVIVTQRQRYMIREAFSSLAERLGEGFVIADKGTCVNVNKISSWNPAKRQINIDGAEIYYSRERNRKIRQLMLERGIPNE